MKNCVLILIFLMISQVVKSQDLQNHEWKNRVLLVISSKENSELVTQQIEILKKENKGLQERKLVVYTIFKHFYQYNFQSKKYQATELYNQFNTENVDFKVILLGLDGGKKLSQKELLSTEKLFTIIDGMPMRRNEMRVKN
ncbi:DUF4174 domain-containing protein [Polaribacter sp.]|nr:DUF4174 domain-containing protein [Polaribacter sp.]